MKVYKRPGLLSTRPKITHKSLNPKLEQMNLFINEPPSFIWKRSIKILDKSDLDNGAILINEPQGPKVFLTMKPADLRAWIY